MKRRGVLTVLAGGAVIPLAGCASSQNPADSQTSGQEALGTAEENIDRATELIGEEATFSFARGPDSSISTDAINLALNDADAALDRVADEQGDISAEKLRAYRDYVSTLRKLAAGLESAGGALNTLSAANAYRNTERYEDATEQLETAGDLFSTASRSIASSRESLDQIDMEVLDTDAISRTRASELYGDLNEIIEAYIHYTDATIPYYEGLDSYWTGVEQYDDEEYEDADLTLVAASGQFETAQTKYRNAESEVSTSIREVFIEQTCVANAMRDSSEQFINATLEARNNNSEQANKYVNQGIDARNRSCRV